MRSTYRLRMFVLIIMMLSCLAGCTQSVPAAEGTEGETAGELTVVNQNFSHDSYYDNIAFILPEDWTYDTYEKMNAGDHMDPFEWGIQVYIEGKSQEEILICGFRDASGAAEGMPEGTESFQTGSGLTGKKYVTGTEAGELELVYVFDPMEGSVAGYRVSYTPSAEVEDDIQPVVDEFVRTISIVTAQKETEE